MRKPWYRKWIAQFLRRTILYTKLDSLHILCIDSSATQSQVTTGTNTLQHIFSLAGLIHYNIYTSLKYTATEFCRVISICKLIIIRKYIHSTDLLTHTKFLHPFLFSFLNSKTIVLSTTKTTPINSN